LYQNNNILISKGMGKFMDLEELKNYAPIVVRYSISILFLWFGTTQLINPTGFVQYLPEFMQVGEASIRSVYLNGLIEVVLGLLLLIGYKVRIVATALALLMLAIIFQVGYNPIGVRNFSLLLAIISVAFYGEDQLCIGEKKPAKKSRKRK